MESPTRTKTQHIPLLKTLASSTSHKDILLTSPSGGDSTTKSFYFPKKTLGFSHTQSASTLLHSSTSWGFPKGSRFPKIHNLTEFKYNDYSTLDKKSTSFGFGSKSEVLEVNSRRSANLPSPNSYRIKSDFEKKGGGKTFGLSYSAYAKTYVPGCTWMPPEIAKEFPGPGHYYAPQIIEPKKPRMTIKPRLKMFNEHVNKDIPSSNRYNPVLSLVESARFRNITFGFGTKHDFTKAQNQNPGPGTYRVVSCFDKIVARKKKKNRKNVL